MKMSKWCLAIVLSMATLAPVSAEVLLYEVRGTVDSLSDPSGQFEGAGHGASFELSYLADFSLGARAGGGGSFGSSNQLTGGSFYAPIFPDTDFTVSPISATLTINGSELLFPGEYFGRVFYVQSYTSGFSRAELTAQSDPDPDGTALTQINTNFYSLDPQTFGSVDVLGSPAIDGQNVTGSTDFTYWKSGNAAGPTVSGTLIPTTYAVTPAIPEASTADMMLLGLLALAGVLSRRTHRHASPRIARAKLCADIR